LRNQFIGSGSANIIETTTATGGTADNNFIGSGSGNIVRDCITAAIVAGATNLVTGSTGGFIATGSGSSITSANYASILAGTSITVSGSLAANTAVSQHSRVLQSFETPGITVIAGSSTVALGNHIYIADGVGGTLALGNSGTIPDGFQFRIRDIGNLGTANVILSCVTAATCIICPPTAACTVAGGTVTLSTQYTSQMYVFRAASQQWIGMSA
jgi:hypothetical protein